WQREHMSKNRLAILPDLTHYEAFLSPRLVETILPFINGVSGADSWKSKVESDSSKK
ncbi:MAG: alpha/beta hydrolase, partial [Bacteroidota bacterium]